MIVAGAAVGQASADFRKLLAETGRAGAPNSDRLEELIAAFRAEIRSMRLSRVPRSEFDRLVEECVRLAEAGTKEQRSRFAYYVGWAWALRSDFGRVRDTLVAARRELGDAHHGAIRSEMLANSYRMLEQTDRALVELTHMATLLESDDLAGRAAIHGVRAEIAYENGVYDEAGRQLKEEQRFAEKSGSVDVLLVSLERRVEYFLATGKHQDALDCIETLLEKCSRKDDPARYGRALLHRGLAEYATETRYPRRDRRARETLSRAIELGVLSPDLLCVAHLKLIEIALRDGDLEAAVEFHRRCLALFERMRVRPQRTALLRALEARLALAEGRPVDELVVALDALRKTHRAQLERWKTLGARRGGVGFLHLDDRRVVLSELVDLILTIARRQGREDGPERALEPILETQLLNTVARARGVGPCSVQDVQRDLLRPGHGMLLYLPSKDRSFVFMIDRDSVECEVLPPRFVLLRELREFVNDLATHPAQASKTPYMDERFLARSENARKALLPEVVEKRVRGWKGITVSGASLLRFVPFAALRLSSGELLGETVAIDSLSSLPLGVHLARQRARVPRLEKPPTLTLLGCTRTAVKGAVAADIESAPFPRPRAVTEIVESYRTDPTRVLFDAQVTRASLKSLAMDSTDVTHILAHCVRNLEVELGTGIAASDGVFWHEDFLRKDVRGLFIISACAAAFSASRLGDSGIATNLGGALMRRGASAVVMSNAPLEVGRHLELMALFHAEIAAGQAPAEALRIARKAKTGDGWVARFYRAQLQVYGLGQWPVR